VLRELTPGISGCGSLGVLYSHFGPGHRSAQSKYHR
jgi:hypothetical protein